MFVKTPRLFSHEGLTIMNTNFLNVIYGVRQPQKTKQTPQNDLTVLQIYKTISKTECGGGGKKEPTCRPKKL